MLKFWVWLKNLINGNKTIIGAFLIMVVNLASVTAWLGNMYDIVIWVISILTGVAGISHLSKQIKAKKLNKIPFNNVPRI